MKTMTKEQIVESLSAIESLPLESRKEEFSRLFRESCDLAESTPAEISHLTRINPEFVHGLYDGKFDGLPSEVFVRGFLKSISRQLKMPQEALVTAYSRTLRNQGPDSSRKSQEEPDVKKPTSSRKAAEVRDLSKVLPKDSDSYQNIENKSLNWTFGDQEVMKPHFMESAPATVRQTLDQTTKSPEGPSSRVLGERKDPSKAQSHLSTGADAHHGLGLHEDAPAVRAAGASKPLGTSQPVSNPQPIAMDDKLESQPSVRDGKSSLGLPADEKVAHHRAARDEQASIPKASQEGKAVRPQATNGQAAKDLSKSAPGFAFSKLWAVMGGVAVVLAAALWPRERAPNGTVIEEPLVSPKAETSDNQREPQVLEAASLPEPQIEPEAGAAPLSSSSSTVPIVPVSSVVKGSLPIPEGKQVVEITAKEDVKIRAFVDGQTMDVDTLSPATHSYSFETNAEFFIYDAAAVNVTFNGRDLGVLGSKGKLRRLTFTKRLKDNKIAN